VAPALHAHWLAAVLPGVEVEKAPHCMHVVTAMKGLKVPALQLAHASTLALIALFSESVRKTIPGRVEFEGSSLIATADG
jgi:hypothetical protein